MLWDNKPTIDHKRVRPEYRCVSNPVLLTHASTPGSLWVTDISGVLGLNGLVEYFQVSVLGCSFGRDSKYTNDQHQWKLEASGLFSTKSAFRAFLVGSFSFEPWKRIQKPWAPGKCKMSIWLAIRDRCWTADRLQKENRTYSPWALPPLWPGRWDSPAHSHHMCFC